MPLIIVKTNAELEAITSSWRSDNQIIGFVPTMGSLHRGHLELINSAKSFSTKTVCSIFVNPTQFNDKSDFDRYPRDLNEDIAKLNQSTCDLLYAPDVSEVYPEGNSDNISFDFGSLATVMEGKFRPGHFQGVATVVKRLFELVKPQVALFGLKDYQQFRIIEQMVADYNIPVKIHGLETIREADGLAMSSRNALLTSEAREMAPVIYKTMQEAREKLGTLPLNAIKLLAEQRLMALPDVRLEYVEIADAQTLLPVHVVDNTQKARIFIAAFFGKIRLIDNMALN